MVESQGLGLGAEPFLSRLQFRQVIGVLYQDPLK